MCIPDGFPDNIFLLISSIIGSLQNFTIIQALTEGRDWVRLPRWMECQHRSYCIYEV